MLLEQIDVIRDTAYVAGIRHDIDLLAISTQSINHGLHDRADPMAYRRVAEIIKYPGLGHLAHASIRIQRYNIRRAILD